MARLVNMTAKKAGTCLNCSKAIEPGEPITWQPKGGAWHRDCGAARDRREQAAERARLHKCHACERLDATCRSHGPYTLVLCPPCFEAWLDAHDFYRQLAKREQATTADAHDMRYEDACARACGLA